MHRSLRELKARANTHATDEAVVVVLFKRYTVRALDRFTLDLTVAKAHLRFNTDTAVHEVKALTHFSADGKGIIIKRTIHTV